MLNAGGTLFILFFTVVSFFCIVDLLTTRLGQLTLSAVVLLYLSRAVEEIIVSDDFSIVIFATCLLVSIIYSVVLMTGLPRHALR
jgi:hypothetical protein